MFPNFKDILKAVAVAGFVLGAAAGFASKAQAGPLDQGPHILISMNGSGITSAIGIHISKELCLAARDSLIKEITSQGLDAKRILLACIPGRNT